MIFLLKNKKENGFKRKWMPMAQRTRIVTVMLARMCMRAGSLSLKSKE